MNLSVRTNNHTPPGCVSEPCLVDALIRGVVLSIVAVLCLLQPTVDFASTPLDHAQEALAKVTGKPVRPFSTRDFGRQQYAGARSVLVDDRDAPALLEKLRVLLPKNTIAFIGTSHSLATPPADGAELVVADGTSQFDILRVAASDAVNYGMGTEDLIKELAEWDRQFGIDVVLAETDTILLRFKTMPKDIHAFAKRLYKFCPDIVDQGTGSVAELEKEIQTTKSVFLWWD